MFTSFSYLKCICMGKMDINWDELEKRPPIDNIIVALGVIVHNVLSYPVYRERRRIENQEIEALRGKGKQYSE